MRLRSFKLIGGTTVVGVELYCDSAANDDAIAAIQHDSCQACQCQVLGLASRRTNLDGRWQVGQKSSLKAVRSKDGRHLQNKPSNCHNLLNV